MPVTGPCHVWAVRIKNNVDEGRNQFSLFSQNYLAV